jgi:hypothetical protein
MDQAQVRYEEMERERAVAKAEKLAMAQRVASLCQHPGFQDLARFLNSEAVLETSAPSGPEWPLLRAFNDGTAHEAIEVLKWLAFQRKFAAGETSQE